MFEVVDIRYNIKYTVYGVKEEKGETFFFIYDKYWVWDHSENYRPLK